MIIIRSDSSYKIGTGHIQRCLQLARELRELGLTVHFVSTELDGHVGHLVQDEKFALTMLAASTTIESEVSLIQNLRPDWIVVDHYQLGLEWEKRFEGMARLFAIDDMVDRVHVADVLLDQNYHSRGVAHEVRTPATSRQYLGPQFSLLKNELLNRKPVVKDPTSVLCFFGGTDYTGETLKLARYLMTVPKLPIRFKLVAGEKNIHLAELKALQTDRFELLVQPLNWTDLLASSTFFLGGGGTVTWERMFLGVPGAVISVAENQRQIAEDLGRDGYQIYLGSFEKQNYADVVRRLTELLAQPQHLEHLALKAKSLVRPFPKELLKTLFVQPSKTDFILKHAEMSDAEFLLDVRNDALTRAMSKNHDLVQPQDHASWLTRKLAEKYARLYVAYVDGERCGQFRVDVDLAVSVSLHAGFRGRGLAAKLIREGSLLFAAEFPGTTLFTAEIHRENTASQKAFALAGYTPHGTVTEGSEYLIYEWKPQI